MICPKCREENKGDGGVPEELFVEIHDYAAETDYQDINFICQFGHKYFCRVKEEDLIEDDS